MEEKVMKKTAICFVLAFLVLTVSASAAWRMVLGENFTNTSCGPCFYADPTLNYLAEEFSEEISLIRYHGWWPGSDDPFYNHNIPENTARINYYGVNSVPDFQIDGIIDAGYQYQQYENRFLQRLDEESPCTITITGNYESGTREVHLEISVYAEEAVPGSSLRLFCVLIENYISYNAPNGVLEHNQTMRDMVPSSNGETFTISQGETVDFARDFTIDNIVDEMNAQVVVFVQDYSTKEVHQTARVDVTDMPTGINDFPQGEIPRVVKLAQNYPNPFNATTNIAFALKSDTDVNLSVYNIAGQKVAELADGFFEAGNHVVNWDASEVSSGVYFYRLETNDEVKARKMILMK
ncbi:MAG: Omp28-related outer membrane protein [candidate division Zixibacteria bacterium]|nr:Omp28-related outer membrane protein [candidate division Zixibacteria bacterium]